MLSEEERREIEQEMGRNAVKQAACIEAMKIVQRHRGGWLSDEGLQDVAAVLGMDASELDGIATFYNMIFRRPIGRHLVLLCDSVSCWIMGEPRIRQALEEHLGSALGETTADGQFTLLPVVCLGACDRAPVMLVGDDLHGDLAPDGVAAILERYR